MKRSDLVVCDSHAVARRLLSGGIAPRLIRVIPLGVGPQFRPGPVDVPRLCALGIRRPFVLYVGSEQPRKNLERLVGALALVKHGPALGGQKNHPIRFVKIGAHQTEAGRTLLLRALRRAEMGGSCVIVEDISDADLVNIYRAAAVTVLPSLHEGFGFPALEAMACGCPVIVSDRDSLPEVTGDSALIVDPLDISAIARAIDEAISHDALRQDLIDRGLRQAATFTWERAAAAYAVLYRELAGSRAARHEFASRG
jgi:glycosyltransferase involved in cell wall biosynthesis